MWNVLFQDEFFVPCEDIVQIFLLILLYLARKRKVSSSLYIPELMEKIQLAKDDDDDDDMVFKLFIPFFE